MINIKKEKFSNLIGFVPIIIFLLIWEIIGRSNIVPEEIFPPFTKVLKEFFELIKNGILLKNFIKSLTRVLIGFTLGSISGIIAGVIIGWNKLLNKAFTPIISILYPIPALGWLPILMLWIGINEMLPIMIIFICSFFPITYNTAYGISSVDKKYIEVAYTLGATKIRTLIMIVFPLALGNIFTGLRLEAGMAWRVIIAAEMIAIPTGIGALMMRAESLVRMDIIIVSLLVLSIMTFLFERFFLYLEKITCKWKKL